MPTQGRRLQFQVRRGWLFLIFALVVTLTSLLVGGFLAGIKDSSQDGFVGALTAEIAWSLVIIVFGLIRTRQRWDDPEPARRLTRGQRRAAGLGGAIGTLARA